MNNFNKNLKKSSVFLYILTMWFYSYFLLQISNLGNFYWSICRSSFENVLKMYMLRSNFNGLE